MTLLGYRNPFRWTVNEEDRLRELAGLGVDGILTDDPALLRRILSAT